MLPSEILTQARDLIIDPTHWCQHWLALIKKDENANSIITDRLISPIDPRADQWCAVGALFKISGFDTGFNFNLNAPFECKVANDFLCNAAFKRGHRTPWGVNDLLGHIKTIDMYDDAITMAKEKENY